MNEAFSKLRAFLVQILLPLAGVIAIDQFSKFYVMQSPEYNIILNKGIMGGVYAQAPEAMKMLLIASVFLLSSFIFVFFQFLFFKQARGLSILTSILLGGFTSNLIDKIRFGAAVDFIPVHLGFDRIFVFNIADFIQQFAMLGLFAYLLRNHRTFWPLIDVRKSWLVDVRFQLTSALFTSVFCVFGGAAVAFVSYLFIASYVPGLDLELFFISVGSLLACLFAGVFFSSLVFFNRAAGPVHASCKFIDKLAQEEYGKMNLRKADYFQNLKISLNKLSERLREGGRE